MCQALGVSVAFRIALPTHNSASPASVNFHSLVVFSRSTGAISPCVRNWLRISSTVDPAQALWPGRNWRAEVTCPRSLVSTPNTRHDLSICRVNIAARLEECHAWACPRSRGCRGRSDRQLRLSGCPAAIQGKAHAVRPEVGVRRSDQSPNPWCLGECRP